MALKRSRRAKKTKQRAISSSKPNAPPQVESESTPQTRPALFDPMREIGRLRRDMERMLEDFGGPWQSHLGPRLPLLSLESNMPALDVYQEDDKVVAKAELPGVDKKDVNVQIDGDLLTVRAEKRKEENVQEDDYNYKERSYGMLSRSIRLPTDVQSEKATAVFKDGVLTMRLPKSDAAKRRSRSIEVQ